MNVSSMCFLLIELSSMSLLFFSYPCHCRSPIHLTAFVSPERLSVPTARGCECLVCVFVVSTLFVIVFVCDLFVCMIVQKRE